MQVLIDTTKRKERKKKPPISKGKNFLTEEKKKSLGETRLPKEKKNS